MSSCALYLFYFVQMYSAALTRSTEITICVDDPPSSIEATIVDAELKGGISLHKNLKILKHSHREKDAEFRQKRHLYD